MAPRSRAACAWSVERKRHQRCGAQGVRHRPADRLPDRQQLIEHMSQLRAARPNRHRWRCSRAAHRGLRDGQGGAGRESANVLRRKVAVRLRGAVRASDVVATLSQDSFALLLASTEEPLDAARGAKVAEGAARAVCGRRAGSGVAASIGISCFPPTATMRPCSFGRRWRRPPPAAGRDGFRQLARVGLARARAANDA